MASNISASNSEELIEERLIAGVLSGSLLQHKELLDTLEDVDGRILKKRTLLHVGVKLGKADWVAELLARGADPDLVDDTQLNALSSAEEMVRRFPEDMGCSLVLKMVSLVHRRDQVITHRLKSSSINTGHMTSLARHDQHIESLKTSMDALRQEMKSLVRQLGSSLEELKAQVCGRDALLHCVEEAVTSTVEVVTSIKLGLEGEASSRQPTSDPAKSKQECVEAMLRKTWIMYGNGVEVMRRFYEKLYDEDDCTACIIKYLSGDDRVKVMVDCETDDIGRMKETVVDLDGTLSTGSEWSSFCDFEGETVFFGANVCFGNNETAVCSVLAWALSQLSLKLVFGNEGRPYSRGDVERECEWLRALEELVGKRERGEGLHSDIKHALNRGTQLAIVCCLGAAVPEIITFHGSTRGRALLQQQAMPLYSLYCNHIMPALLAKVRR
ncbi:uncharacterized protein LOC124172203 isoform X2 [Ischnura elegans]|uniref:uncharacterized protein LOC124172203 isoform X2 n=1 Tax=Ischnura elegans TaxID=197161 RepID=UPI001ED86C2C|nr:uncharacterized protein LOC124172203 isoform X2 [Ischnura elegans]